MKERLPDPGSLIQTLDYLEYEASIGHFTGKTTAYAVLIYLARNAWRKVPNTEEAPVGAVMWGKSGMRIVAEHNGMSPSSARRSLRWLEGNGWIKCELDHDVTGRQNKNYIRILLDQTAHEHRQLQREVETLGGGRQIDRDVGGRLTVTSRSD